MLVFRNWGNYPGNHVFYSADFGTSFSKVFTSNVQENRGTVVSDDLFYITTLFTEILSSSDARDWTSIYQGEEIGGVYIDHTDNQLFISYDGIGQKSADFGKSWTTLPSSNIPFVKMSNGDYLSYFQAKGIYRSNDKGTSWLPLSFIKNGTDAIVEHKDRLIINDGTGLYILEYGKTYMNYVPKNEPVNGYYNYRAKNLYSFNGQLFIREDKNSPWRLTMSFPADQKVAYYTRTYYNRIYVVTQNSFGGNTILHQINSAGNYIEKSTSLPWTGGVTHFISNPGYIAAIFKGNGNERDYIAYAKYGRGDWTAINLPTDYQKIHFIEMKYAEVLGIGYEGKQSKNYQEYAVVR